MAVYDAALNNGAFLRLIVEENSQNIAGNSSTDGYQLELHRGSNTASWTAGPVYWSVTINGVLVAHGSFGFSTGSAPIVLVNGTTVVGHNSNGTKVTSVQASMTDTGTAIGGPASINSTFTQTTIPRASTPTFKDGLGNVVTSLDAGEPLLIETNRASSSFTHTLEYSMGAASGTIATGVGVSTTWNIPLSILNQIPNALSGVCTITTKTYSGATLIGTTTKNITIKVPTSVVPDFGTITHSEAVSAVNTNVGAYVQSLSKLNLAITSAVGSYGSTISSYKITVAGQTINAQSGTTPAVLANSGTVAIVGTVTDSRGRTHSETVNITVLAYSVPTITSAVFRRADAAGTVAESGTYIRVDLNASVTSLVVSAVQKNSMTYKIYTRARGGSTWTLKETVNLSAGTISFNSFDWVGTYLIEDSWEVLVEVIDKFSTSSVGNTVGTATIFMHWGGDAEGLGVGKFWEQGGLDVLGQIYQNNGLAVIDTGDSATASLKGIVELATDAETQTGTDTSRAITPANLSSRTATETRTGIAELATAAEATAGSDASRIITAARAKEIKNFIAAFSVTGGGSAQNASNNTATLVNGTWTTPEINNAQIGSWSSGVLTITRAGLYLVSATIGFATQGSPFRGLLQVLKNSTTWDGSGRIAQGAGYGINGNVVVSRLVELAASDVLRVYVMQQSGGTIAMDAGFPTSFSVVSVGAI